MQADGIDMDMNNLQIMPCKCDRQKELPLGDPAEESSNVFISLEATVERIKRLLEVRNKGSATFIRAAVATGKTTLAKYLAISHSDEFIMTQMAKKEDDIRRNIIETIHRSVVMESEMPSTFTIALEALAKANKTLILDEAHLLFENTNLVEEMFKYPQQWIGIPKPKFLLFSAAGTGQDKDGNSVVTPSEIRNKYMWYPPIPNGKELTNELKDAEVYLSVESVMFFMKLCCGHRGIFMSAMEWVQECQKDSTEEWNIHESVARVRASFEESRKEQLGGWNKGLRRYLTQSRAVRVNGKFSTLGNIPKEFAEVLLGGSKTKSGLNNQERSLTINGFLVPEQEKNDGEFVQCDWNDVVKLYVTSNSLMAEYYGDLFPKELGYQRQLIETDPKSGADMVARALPFMSFATIVDNLIPANGRELKTSLSADHLPYEDHYNSAMAQVLKDMKYTVSTPLNPITGKVDVLVTLGGDNICAIETILATRGQVSCFLWLVCRFFFVVVFFLTDHFITAEKSQ